MDIDGNSPVPGIGTSKSHLAPSSTPKNSEYITRKIRQLDGENRPVNYVRGHKNIVSYNSRGYSVALNSRIVRKVNNQEERICCRHLSLGRARGTFKPQQVTPTEGDQGGNGFSVEEAPLAEAIKRHKGIPTEEEYDHYWRGVSSVEAYYFNPENITDALEVLLSRFMQDADPSQKHYLFESLDHSMTLRVKNKKGAVALSFYDPNDTLKEKKFLFKSVEDIKKISIDDLLDKKTLQYYFPESVAIIKSVETTQNQSDCFVSLPDRAAVNGRFLYEALMQGHVEAVQKLMKEALTLPIIENEVKEFFQANNATGDYCGVQGAIFHQHEQAIVCYLDNILSAPISEKLKESIFVKLDELNPGHVMHFFIVEDSERIMGIFTRCILNAQLISPGLKMRLLLAEDTDGVPAFHYAFHYGAIESINAFTKLILQSQLTEQDKVKLLMARTSNGVTGARAASELGHDQALQLFSSLITQSNLSERSKRLLLDSPADFNRWTVSIQSRVCSFLAALRISTAGLFQYKAAYETRSEQTRACTKKTKPKPRNENQVATEPAERPEPKPRRR